ncbi:hypothetical protein AV530_010012 [Patagioenas fasciata monilis]|uniref:Uncharacterized protein n=1 Tax=Patagioenas fasciata monilis TaxID=372326 RepID=A0A1V4KB78_PATFA|nr:hypothetical protein AV530_010012 [Patagioenas fasciata monilis]
MLATCNFAPTCPQLKTMHPSTTGLSPSQGHGFPRKIPVAEGVDHVILCYKYLLSSKPRDFDPFIQFRLEKKYISGPFKSRRGRRTPAKW